MLGGMTHKHWGLERAQTTLNHSVKSTANALRFGKCTAPHYTLSHHLHRASRIYFSSSHLTLQVMNRATVAAPSAARRLLAHPMLQAHDRTAYSLKQYVILHNNEQTASPAVPFFRNNKPKPYLSTKHLNDEACWLAGCTEANVSCCPTCK